MDNVELQTEYYKKSFASFGPYLEALGWHSKKSQKVRFKVLSSIGDLTGRSILDVGCGFGDFFGYLWKNIELEGYLGVDLIEDMIKEAYKRYPEGAFMILDILNNDGFILNVGRFDYVLASGIFGLESSTWDLYVQSMLVKMFEICRIGVGVNFLLTRKYQESDSHYTSPDVIVDLVREISPKVECKLGYKENDFTIFIYK